jgi:dolichol-phosphate mannosyltransferase
LHRSTVEHLHLELRLHNVPHEIIVVDDGSTRQHRRIMTELGRTHAGSASGPERPASRIWPRHRCRLASDERRRRVIMMADESDDCRDVVRYWNKLNEGWDAVFGSRFMKGGGVIDYPWLKLRLNRLANLFIRRSSAFAQRHHQRVQGLSPHCH